MDIRVAPGVIRRCPGANRREPVVSRRNRDLCPGHAQDIVAPSGFRVSVFASGLNQPTGIAFLGNKANFKVYVLESGHGLPSPCNEQGSFGTGDFDPTNPFTPDVLVFDKSGNKIAGPLFKPTASGGLQAAGPAIAIAFVNGFSGGRLFASDSNQATYTHNGQNNSSRVVILNLSTGTVTPFITGLPTGDHPTEQLAFRADGWIYWSQGSTTNSGVVGLDNGSGQNQSDIPCQQIVLSNNVFISSLGPPVVATSGYSPFGVQQPGATIPAFFNSFTNQIRTGVCDGATLRAGLNNPNVIQAYGWGHRNG